MSGNTFQDDSTIATSTAYPTSLQAPNIGNYYIGKGLLSIQLLGESGYTKCGNVPEFTFESKVTSLDHFSSMQGVRYKDFVAVTEVAGSITLQMEEFTARNMTLALLGSAAPTGTPSPLYQTNGPTGTTSEVLYGNNPELAQLETIQLLQSPLIYCSLLFQGTNIIGPQYTINFPIVKLSPSKAVSLIGNEWGVLEFEGDVLYDGNINPATNQPYGFGTATVAQPISAPSQAFL